MCVYKRVCMFVGVWLYSGHVVFVYISCHACMVIVNVCLGVCIIVGVCACMVIVLCLFASLAMFVW